MGDGRDTVEETPSRRASAAIRDCLTDLDLSWSEPDVGRFTVTLPGTRKLHTECALVVGRHRVSIRAFVARCPDEHAERVHRWLLERNLKLAIVAFSLDRLGDVYLTGQLPCAMITTELVDSVLGIVADTADTSFNTILKLGFASSIRAEWAWRRSRGLSTRNLDQFRDLDPARTDPGDSR